MQTFRLLSRVNWTSVLWIGMIHVGALFAPFAFSWSALGVCVTLYLLTILGVTIGYHRLLTHRSFQTFRPVEYVLTILGTLAVQGGVLSWVATHRAHHANSDEKGDPHSPRDGSWWSHLWWWMAFDPILDDPVQRRRYIRDLAKDRVHRFLHHCQLPFQLALGLLLYALGEAWGGVGLTWFVWGIFVRTTVAYHATWLVNSATHRWGYQTYRTRDDSTNLWWVAIFTCGEGWHNNHHAFPSSARHGLRWWEVDLSYMLIRLLNFVGLAWRIQLPHKHAPCPPEKLPREQDEEPNHGGTDAGDRFELRRLFSPRNLMRRAVGIICGIALLAGMPCLILLALISALTGSR